MLMLENILNFMITVQKKPYLCSVITRVRGIKHRVEGWSDQLFVKKVSPDVPALVLFLF